MISEDLPSNPLELFERHFKLASQQSRADATAMILSTVSKEGVPSSRVVLLKSYSDEGFTFYTNYTSRKASQIQANRHVALCFYWPEINIQIRVEGIASPTDEVTSDEYFQSRPRLSQLGAWASNQSSPLDSRQDLLDSLQQFEKEYEGKPVPRPPHWGGYIVVPRLIEFWYNGDFRLHDRFVYTRSTETEPNWTIQRINP